MRISHRILPLVIAILGDAVAAFGTDIVISGQAEFDRLQELVDSHVARGERDISVVLDAGTYFYRDGHLRLHCIADRRLSLGIRGRGRCVLVGRGRQLKDGNSYAGTFYHYATLLDGNLEEASMWSRTMQAADTVRVTDAAAGECLIPYRGLPAQSAGECRDTYVRLTMWFRSAVYRVTRISSEGVHFACPDLKYDAYLGTFNVNADYGFRTNVGAAGPTYPRFRLCNAVGRPFAVVAGKVRCTARDGLYECRAVNFLAVDSCSLRGVTVEGLEFRGNMYGWNRAVLQTRGSRFAKGMTVAGNTFRYLKTEALRCEGSENVSYSGNRAEDCAMGVVRADNLSRRTRVTGNTFGRCGTDLSNTFAVYCTGTDFTVADNVFRDFGYGAVRTGVWWGEEMAAPCRGTIERNDISYSADYMARLWENTLMDGGAIYVATQNDRVSVRDNNIHGYSGMFQNRGIFLDAGSNNCHVTDNTVTGVPNCYSIDLHFVDFSDNPANRAPHFNRGNSMSGNRCDGKVRFETY